MLAIVIALSILATVPVILVRPHVGILAWFWVGLMNPHRQAWGSLENLRYALMIAAATLLAWVLSRESKRIPVTLVTVMLGLFTIWISLTTVMAHHPADAFPSLVQALKILLMTFVAVALINTRERIYALVWLMVVCLGFYGFQGGVFTILTGGEYHVFGPPRSFIADNNQLALALIMILPFIAYLYQQAAHPIARIGLIGLGVMSVFSIIGSQSRGAFLALCLMGLFLAANSRYRLRMGVAVLAMAAVGAMFVPQSWVDRMETIQNAGEDKSVQGRFQAWQFAYEVARDNPITGGGFNVHFDETYYKTLVPEAETNRNFHSVYFEVLGEQGFVGLAIFLALMGGTWLTFGHVIRATRSEPELRWAHDLGRMGQVSLLGYASAGAFLNLAFFDLYYLVVALAVMAADQVHVARAVNAPSSHRRRAPVHASSWSPSGSPAPSSQ